MLMILHKFIDCIQYSFLCVIQLPSLYQYQKLYLFFLCIVILYNDVQVVKFIYDHESKLREQELMEAVALFLSYGHISRAEIQTA